MGGRLLFRHLAKVVSVDVSFALAYVPVVADYVQADLKIELTGGGHVERRDCLA